MFFRDEKSYPGFVRYIPELQELLDKPGIKLILVNITSKKL